MLAKPLQSPGSTSGLRNSTSSPRKLWQTMFRARTKALMGQERWEDIKPFQRTSGWLTW